MKRKTMKISYVWQHYVLNLLKILGIILLIGGLISIVYLTKINDIDSQTVKIISKIKNNYDIIGQEADKQKELKKEIEKAKKSLENSIKKVIILENENTKLKKQLFPR